MKKSEISNILNKMKVKVEQLEKKIKKQNADKLKFLKIKMNANEEKRQAALKNYALKN